MVVEHAMGNVTSSNTDATYDRLNNDCHYNDKVKILGRPTSELFPSRISPNSIPSFLLLSSLIFAFVIPQMVSHASASSLAVIAPPDKTITTSGSSIKVALGTSEATGTTDLNPKFSNNAPGSTAAPTGAVGYWSFDDDVDDKSGSRNHGVAKGDAHIVTDAIGGALLLDGQGDYVTVKDNWNLHISGAFTLSAWINLQTLSPSSGSYLRVLEKGTPTGEKLWMFYAKSSKVIGFGFISPSGDIQIKTKKTDWQVGKWYHVVGTYDPSVSSNNMKIYVDGMLDNQATMKGKPAANSYPLMIGTRSTASSDFWQGKIDEVRIYSRALTATEVANLNKSPFVSLPAGTNMITWKVTDNKGNSATAVQAVSVVRSGITTPLTSLALNGVRYIDTATGDTFVTSGSHFNLSVQSLINIKSTYYRFYKADDSLFRPSFSSGKYFQINGAYNDGEFITQFYSININGLSEPIKQKNVILDNSPPMTSLSVVTGSSDGRVRLTATDNYKGAGVGNALLSGMYYKLDSALTFSYIKSSTVDIKNVVNGAHTIYYYSVDNLGNTEATKSAKFTGKIYSFCYSGCGYNNLQTAINALPLGGGKINIKDGAYTLSNTITLKSGAVLDFSAGSSIYFRGNGIPLFSGTGVNNIQVIGGKITAEQAGASAFSFSNSKEIKVTGTKITMVKGSDSNAFNCVNCSGVYLSNIDAKSASRLVDIKTSSGRTDGKSSNIWVTGGKYDDSSIEGVKVNYSVNVHITGITLSNTAENGIDIGWNSNSEVRDNRITDTGIPNGAAIHTDSAIGAAVLNNYIDTTGRTAIPVYRASNIDVIGNTIINAGDQGISIIDKIEPSSIIKVSSNHIITSKGTGIYESPEQSNVDISFNTFRSMPGGTLPIYITGSNPTTINYGNMN